MEAAKELLPNDGSYDMGPSDSIQRADLTLTQDELNWLGKAIDIAVRSEGVVIASHLVPLFGKVDAAARSLTKPS